MLTRALVLLLAFAATGGDRVVLKNGKELTGRIVFEDDATLVLRQDERDTPIERAAIARVDSRLANLATLLDNAARADLAQVAELELLAAQAAEMGLAGEAQVFWWRLALFDPGHEAARRALGHEPRASGWTVPLGGRRVDWHKRFELARDWGKAWELESLHYRLRSNLPLETNLEVLLDLERLYLAFYRLFGAELRLYDLTRPLAVHLHADRASYPETANDWGSYDTETDTVHVNASGGLAHDVLAHELTHQLLYDTAFRANHEASGELPPWLDEGLAEYVAGCVTGAPEIEFEAGRVEVRHFRAHAEAPRPFDLKRVLAFSSGDYFSSSDRQLKYAQSYTLVHFLLHADAERHRAGFFRFLREVYAGKGSATDLKRALDVEWRALEEAWQAYASRRAR